MKQIKYYQCEDDDLERSCRRALARYLGIELSKKSDENFTFTQLLALVNQRELVCNILSQPEEDIK